MQSGGTVGNRVPCYSVQHTVCTVQTVHAKAFIEPGPLSTLYQCYRIHTVTERYMYCAVPASCAPPSMPPNRNPSAGHGFNFLEGFAVGRFANVAP